MKTKGFSETVVDLCMKLDRTYVDLLEDVSLYLYGKEYNSEINLALVWKDFKFKRKHFDTEEVENHLRSEVTRLAMEYVLLLHICFYLTKCKNHFKIAKVY